MEKVHLNVMPQRSVEHDLAIECPEREKEIYEKIAKAFLRQRYPLTEEGERLKAEVEDALQGGDEGRLKEYQDRLPTVEDPHLELFQDLQIEGKEAEEIFGGLTNAQTTKGCRHKCTFCAAGSADKIDTMPFAAVLKIAEQKIKVEQELLALWERWPEILKEAGIVPEEYIPMVDKVIKEVKSFDQFDARDKEQADADVQAWERLKSDIPEDMGLGYDIPHWLGRVGSMWNKKDGLAAFGNVFAEICTSIAFDVKSLVEKYPAMKLYLSKKQHTIFPWRKDGIGRLMVSRPISWRGEKKNVRTPIIYGMIFFSKGLNTFQADTLSIIMTAIHLIIGIPLFCIAMERRRITAMSLKRLLLKCGLFISRQRVGRKRDRSAQQAAENLVRLSQKNSDRFSGVRISISPYELTARRDLPAYVEDMKNVLFTLGKGLQLEGRQFEVRYFLDPNDPYAREEFEKNVVQRLNTFIKEESLHCYISFPSVSTYSGPLAQEAEKDDHHDVMACMPGVHIWPDGTVSRQKLPTEQRRGRDAGGVPAARGRSPSESGYLPLVGE